MVEVSTRSLDQIVAEEAVAAQAAAGPGKALDFSTGSVFRALGEGFGAVGLWLQAQLLRVLLSTRAATSRLADLDTWMEQFRVVRAAATTASGVVTFSRFTPAPAALVKPGAAVKTADGVWTFVVAADPRHPAWDAALGGYAVAPGVAGVSVRAVAQAAGAGGNAAPGTVTLLASALPGIDAATNAAPFAGGSDAETDDALRARFVAYINSLSLGVRAAIDYAIGQVRPGLTWSVINAEAPGGQPAAAFFTVVVDDGSGAPPASLIAAVAAAVERVRALGVAYAVVAPVRIAADVSLALVTAAGSDRAAVVGAVASAVAAYIDALPLGTGLAYTRLAQVAYEASADVLNVTGLRLNGGTADIPGSPRLAVRAGVVAVA